MKIQKVKITAIKSNPNNPRLIKDDKFHKLVKSIKEFPQMLELRPIVVNDEMVVLGGNMRLKACIEAGFKEVWIIKASSLTPEQQKEFIVKDNVGFGEWDFEILANEWEVDKLEEWNVETWRLPTDLNINFAEDIKDTVTNNEKYKDTDGYAMDYLNSDMKKFEIFIEKEDYEKVVNNLKNIKESKGFKNNSEAISWLILNYDTWK